MAFIKVSTTWVYPGIDRRTYTRQYMEEDTLENRIKKVLEEYNIDVKYQGYLNEYAYSHLFDRKVYQIIGIANFSWSPECIITIEEIRDAICTLAEIYSCETSNYTDPAYGGFEIKSEKAFTKADPLVRIKKMYYRPDYNQNDDIEYVHVYELEEVE